MSTAKHIKRKARHLAEDAEDRIEDAHEEMDAALEEGEGAAMRWAPILAVAGIAAIGLFMILRRRRESRLQRGAHEAVDKAFRLTSDARESARELAERSSRWLAKMPRVRVEMP